MRLATCLPSEEENRKCQDCDVKEVIDIGSEA
jgi:hypothetical protein